LKLLEGKYYWFKVLKIVEIPEEGDFYLLKHKSGRRLLLPVSIYKNYLINPDSTIECRVDKVNCTGKVFLEPKHPHYSEGKYYNFIVKYTDKNDCDLENSITVADVFNNEIRMEWPKALELPKVNSTVRLKVERVKKGIPVLVNETSKHATSGIVENFVGELFSFIVSKVLSKGKEQYYLLVENKHELKAYIKAKHYKHYNIKLNSNILCKIIGVNSDNSLKVEPQNPYYIENTSYNFIVSMDSTNEFTEEYRIGLIDKFGNKCGITVNGKDYQVLKNKTQLTCRVIGFRKGKPMLELIK